MTQKVVLYAMKGWNPPKVEAKVTRSIRIEKSEKTMKENLALDLDMKPLLGLTFQERFPELYNIVGNVDSIFMDDIKTLLDNQRPLYSRQLQIFGAKFNSYIFGPVLIVLMFSSLLIFSIHYSNYINLISTQENQNTISEVPWIGLYECNSSIFTFYTTVVLLPVLVSITIYIHSIGGKFENHNLTGLVICLLISIKNTYLIYNQKRKVFNGKKYA